MNNPNQRPANMTQPPSGRPPMAPPRGPRPPMGPVPGGMAMTPKEIVGIVRRHVWMIIIFTFLGVMLGGGAWFLCDRYIPKYTSRRPIDVAPPIVTDVTKIVSTQPNKDIYYQFRVTKAAMIKQDHMLKALLEEPKVQTTKWFKKYAKLNAAGEIIGDRAKALGDALEDIKKNLGASAPRDNTFLLVSMSCGCTGYGLAGASCAVDIVFRRRQVL